MTRRCDVIVIGGGPAGVEAALAAAHGGLEVVLLDEAHAAGGQVYRAPPAGFRFARATPEGRAGAALRQTLAESRVTACFDHMVWSVSPGFRVDALGPEGAVSWQAPRLVVATGAQERVVPFPGWTLPGVVGLAGATILLKSQGMLPGRRTLVVGQGPLLLAVGAGILKAGGTVAGVIDLAPRREWLTAIPALMSRPDLAVRGIRWIADLLAAGVPLLSRQALRHVSAAENGALFATVGPVDAAGRPISGPERSFAVDAVAVGNGLTCSTDVTRLLRAKHRFEPLRGGWIPETDRDFRTSVPGLFATGDGAGLAGAAAAAIDGRLAGLAAARDCGASSSAIDFDDGNALRRSSARARRFGDAMAKLMALRSGQVAAIPTDAVVCRCEDVTRGEIDAAVAAGARTANQVKAWTRCGMGPCQGRICGDVVGALVAGPDGERGPVGFFTGRTPFRPLPLDQLAGSVDYAELQLPPPAPL